MSLVGRRSLRGRWGRANSSSMSTPTRSSSATAAQNSRLIRASLSGGIGRRLGLGPTDTKTRWDHFAAALQVFVDYFRWFTVKPDVGADSSLIEMAIRASRKHRILGPLSTLLRHLPDYTERPVRRMGQEARDVRHWRKTEGLLFRSPLWLAVPYQTSSHTQCATYSLSENALGALSRLMVRMRCASHPALDRFLG